MIKHGPIYKVDATGISKSHLEPIMAFVTRGIADAKEKITLTPQACDVKGAKRFNGQQCVIARCLTRSMKPQAVAVGRSLAYAVFKGVAVRFRVPPASQKLVEEFDQRGRARSAPFDLSPIFSSWKLGAQRNVRKTAKKKNPVKRVHTKQMGVRAAGGGIAA